MFCPNYKIKDVFDRFNEMIEALGGKPMTEEEFRSSELRNKRTGLDYSAMESAYKVYHRNGGHFLDETPQGKPSLLFNTLLDYFGDRSEAIAAKANVYSDEFFNWFGNWTGQYGIVDDSIKHNIITPEGEINWDYFESLLDKYHNKQPDSMFAHGRYTLSTRPENHFSEEKNTLNHIKFVTQSMLNLLEGKYDMDLPFVSEARASLKNQKDLMILAAMFHDAAKPYRHGDIHGWESADILRDVLGLNYDNRLAEWAVRHHMPMPFSHKADFNKSNPEALEVAKNIARDAKRVGIDANTAINAWVLINAADVINGRELSVEDNWAKKATANGPTRYGDDLSVKNVLSIELKEKVELLKWAFDQIKDEEFGDTVYNYNNQERFDYQAFPEGGREDKKLPYLNNASNVSKVVDENGEPLVVWHGGSMTNIFDTSGKYISAGIKKGDVGTYFTTDKESAISYENIHAYKYEDGISTIIEELKEQGLSDEEIDKEWNTSMLGLRSGTRPFYINIKNPKNTYYAGNRETGYDLLDTNVGNNDGQTIKVEDHKDKEYVAFNPNQIKHVKNLGTFSTEDNNIYHISAKPNTTAYRRNSTTLEQFFDNASLIQLLDGKSVSVSNIIPHLLDTGSFAKYNLPLAKVAQKHNVPVMFASLPKGKPMATVEIDGVVYIEIDPEQITQYTTETTSEYLLHEVVHALSVKAIRNPLTEEERAFSTATMKLYDILDKLMPETDYNRASMDSGGYILADVYEFAAVFATDRDAKMLVYQKALDEDKKGNNKVFLRLKLFINSLSRLLWNKNVFKGLKSDEVKLYLKNLNNFLLTRRVQEYIDPAELFNEVLESTYNPAMNDLQTAMLRENLTRRQGNVIRHYVTATEDTTDATRHKRLWDTRVKVSEALEKRLAAINSSTLDLDLKVKAKLIIDTQLSQFKNKTVPTVVVLLSFLLQTLPQLLEDVDSVRAINDSTHSYYMYNMHDNFGAYAAIFDMLSKDVKDHFFRDELNEEFSGITTIDRLSITRDIDSMISVINDAAATAQDGVRYMYNILLNNVRRDLAELSTEINYSDTQAFLDQINSIGFDTNSFIDILGSKDGAQDPLLKSIVYLVNKALRKSKDLTREVVTKLLKLKDKLAPGESLLTLYEVDDEGRTTQFLVRDLNFGKFYKDYREFQESLNEKYGLPKGNRSAPSDVETRRKYNQDKNKWLSEHCERRFVLKYYDAYASLSDDTLEQLNAIRTAIAAIKYEAFDETDKMYHYDRLSEEQWKRLQGLYIQKRVLASDYTIYGDLKIEGTDQYRWAKELQQLNETLYSKTDQEIKYATELWETARKKVLKEAIDRYTTDGEVNLMAVKRVIDKWDERNSKRVFKGDDNGLIIFNLIKEETEKNVGFEEPVYELNGDGGAAYQANKERINSIINLFRDYNTGEPNLEVMPAQVKANLKRLEKENKDIRKNAIAGNRELIRKSKAFRKEYRKVFNKYLKTEYTKYYRRLHPVEDMFVTSSDDVRVIKKRWETILRVNKGFDEEGVSYQEKFTELIPGDGWINRDDNDQLLNIEYKKAGYDVPYIPKRELYDNSKLYERIMSSPTLKAVYTALVGDKETGETGILQEANAKQFNRQYQDDYLLPGITGSMWKYMKNHGVFGSVTQALIYTGDHLGFTQQGISQDTSFGQSVDSALESINDLYEVVSSENQVFGGKSTGTRPDGRLFSIIPQYYTKRLEDPSQLSSDLIGIVCSYYENACNFENKSEIKDYVESLVDAIENRRYEILNKSTGNREVKEGSQTKTFKSAKKFVEMNLYNIRSDNNKIGLNIGDSRYELSLGKTALNFSRLTQALNLGMSPAVALTGFFTAQYTHLINAIVGDRGYGMNEWTQATGEVISHYIRNYGGVQYASNLLSNDKVMLLAEMFDVSNQLKRKFKNTNRSRFVRFLDNWCFGGLTACDFASKSTIMVTVLMSHRFMNGKFMTKEDVLNMLEASTEEGRKRLLEQWEKGKNLYSIFSVKDRDLLIDAEYREAFEKVRHVVYSRINKTAENADGMATETQKAAMTTNFFGAAVLTHRQYLPLMIQLRFLPMTYDFDMQMYTQGQYLVDWQFFRNVCLSSAVDLIKSKSIQSAINTWKQNYDIFLNDTSSEENWKISRARKKALKKTITELSMFFITVVPLVLLICMFADRDDKKDELALQLAAYIARRVLWEVFTPYRMSDIFNNVKSPSAQTGTLDKFSNLWSLLSRRAMPQASLLDTLLGLEPKSDYNDIIMRGVYEGHSRMYKALMQMTPYHNLYEQWYGSKQKRSYYEKQIMQLND